MNSVYGPNTGAGSIAREINVAQKKGLVALEKGWIQKEAPCSCDTHELMKKKINFNKAK